MKLVADESVDAPLVAELRGRGFEIDDIREIRPGASDQDVLALANKSDAALVTADKDFGELVFRLRQANAGVILVRLSGVSEPIKSSLAAEAIESHIGELKRGFMVITAGTIRIRHRDDDEVG